MWLAHVTQNLSGTFLYLEDRNGAESLVANKTRTTQKGSLLQVQTTPTLHVVCQITYRLKNRFNFASAIDRTPHKGDVNVHLMEYSLTTSECYTSRTLMQSVSPSFDQRLNREQRNNHWKLYQRSIIAHCVFFWVWSTGATQWHAHREHHKHMR